MTVFPYATQAQGWGTFATDLDSAMAGLDPAVLMPGQSGGLISEHIDALYVLQKSGVGLADSAAALAGVCAQQDGYDHELASNPVTRERVELAAGLARDMRTMMRRGEVGPEQVEKADAAAADLAKQREEAIARHAQQTSGTCFPEPESIEIPEVGEGGEANKKDGEPGTKRGDTDGYGDWGTPGEEKGEKKPSDAPAPSDGVTPLPEIVTPEPSGPTETPAPRVFSPDGSVELRPERVQPETTLSRGDAPLVAPSSSMLGQQTPTPTSPSTAPWQPPQYSGISQPQGRMLGNVNPNNQQQRKDRQEPEWNRPVPAETLAAIPVAHSVTSHMSTAPHVPPMTPGTPGTHTSAASVPTAPTTPSGQTPSSVGPTPVSTVGPGSRAAVTSGGMREKPSVPETLRAVLDEQTVRDLERSLDDKFPDPEPTADPIPTGALR